MVNAQFTQLTWTFQRSVPISTNYLKIIVGEVDSADEGKHASFCHDSSVSHLKATDSQAIYIKNYTTGTGTANNK
jgi:hypothetical protein